MEEKEIIAKLRYQVKCMREIISFLDKRLSSIMRRPTPDLPDLVFEDVEGG